MKQTARNAEMNRIYARNAALPRRNTVQQAIRRVREAEDRIKRKIKQAAPKKPKGRPDFLVEWPFHALEFEQSFWVEMPYATKIGTQYQRLRRARDVAEAYLGRKFGVHLIGNRVRVRREDRPPALQKHALNAREYLDAVRALTGT